MTPLSRRQVFLVAARALIFLPFLLAAWYFAGMPLAWVAGKAAAPIVRMASGGLVTMHVKERTVEYAVKLEMPYRPGGAPRVAADVEVEAAKFTYGIAFFLALALAARQSRKGVGIVVSCALLLVLPGIGVAFDTLKQLGATPGLQAFLGWSAGSREGIALGYQVGTLLLPTLGPVAMWLVLARELWAPPPASVAAVTE